MAVSRGDDMNPYESAGQASSCRSVSSRVLNRASHGRACPVIAELTMAVS